MNELLNRTGDENSKPLIIQRAFNLRVLPRPVDSHRLQRLACFASCEVVELTHVHLLRGFTYESRIEVVLQLFLWYDKSKISKNHDLTPFSI